MKKWLTILRIEWKKGTVNNLRWKNRARPDVPYERPWWWPGGNALVLTVGDRVFCGEEEDGHMCLLDVDEHRKARIKDVTVYGLEVRRTETEPLPVHVCLNRLHEECGFRWVVSPDGECVAA